MKCGAKSIPVKSYPPVIATPAFCGLFTKVGLERYMYLPIPLHKQDVTQSQFFKWSLTG